MSKSKKVKALVKATLTALITDKKADRKARDRLSAKHGKINKVASREVTELHEDLVAMIVSGLDNALHIAGLTGDTEVKPDSLLRWVTKIVVKTEYATLSFKVKGADYTAKVKYSDGYTADLTEFLKDTDMDFFLMDSTPVSNAPAVSTLTVHLLKLAATATQPTMPHVGKQLNVVCMGSDQALVGVKPLDTYTKLCVEDLYTELLKLVELQLVHGKSPLSTRLRISSLLLSIELADIDREFLRGLMTYALNKKLATEFVHDSTAKGAAVSLATLLVNSVICKCKDVAVEEKETEALDLANVEDEDEDDSDSSSKQLLTVDEALARLPTIGVDLGQEVAMDTIRDIAVRLGLFPASQVNIIELNHIIDLIYSKFPKPKADTDLPVKRPTKQRAARAKLKITVQ